VQIAFVYLNSHSYFYRMIIDTSSNTAPIRKPVAGLAALYPTQTGIQDLDENVNSRLPSWHIPENKYINI